MMFTTTPEVLNSVWINWRNRAQVNRDQGLIQGYWTVDYSKVSRRSPVARTFEDWLFKHAAMVVQIDHKRHLRFINEEDATFFLLTNS